MIRRTAWALILMVLAVAASPATAVAVPAGASMMPLNGMPMNHGSGQESSGCPCAMPAQPAAAPPAPALPRAAGGQEQAPCSGSAVSLTNGLALTGGRAGGIRRISAKNILDHPDRASVYTVIAARPGIDQAGIGAELSLNRETLRYHLDRLESAARIVVLRDRGTVRYFENHGRYTLLERRVLQHLWNPTGREILALIAARPGVTQAEISLAAAVAPPTARWYLHRFRDDGIVTVQRDGKFTRYAVVPEVGKFFTFQSLEHAVMADAPGSCTPPVVTGQ